MQTSVTVEILKTIVPCNRFLELDAKYFKICMFPNASTCGWPWKHIDTHEDDVPDTLLGALHSHLLEGNQMIRDNVFQSPAHGPLPIHL